MNTNFINAGWDSENSTYCQEISFTDGRTIVGYSRKIGFAEMRDKKKLLTNWILRSYQGGYLNATHRSKGVVCIKYSKMIEGRYKHFLTLYQDYPEWVPNLYDDKIQLFLNKFYFFKREGKDPYQLLYERKKDKQYNPIDLDSQRFFNRNDLRLHCVRIINDGVREKSELQNYYIKYVKKYFGGLDSSDKRFLGIE